MRIWNQTKYPAEFTTATDKAGHEHVVIVVKATFQFPDAPGAIPELSPEQAPLVMADTHTGVPGFSATLWETDFAFRKSRCDIIANASAYAPEGRPAERVTVGIKLGNWQKAFDVVGWREWRARGPLFAATRPEPFLRQPFSYNTAWGGTDRLDPDDQQPGCYANNPFGTGWARTKNQQRIPGLRLPNTEALGEEIRSPFGDYRPMSFSPFGRGWPGRIEYGGTYDDDWATNIFPFLPPDFDERYYQMAPPDQQTDSPRGGEDIVLVGLTPRGRESFRLPAAGISITFIKGREKAFEATLFPDTVLFDPENRRFSLVWRVSQRIERTILDFSECWVGPPTASMLRAFETGRTYERAGGTSEAEDA